MDPLSLGVFLRAHRQTGLHTPSPDPQGRLPPALKTFWSRKFIRNPPQLSPRWPGLSPPRRGTELSQQMGTLGTKPTSRSQERTSQGAKSPHLTKECPHCEYRSVQKFQSREHWREHISSSLPPNSSSALTSPGSRPGPMSFLPLHSHSLTLLPALRC